MANTIRTLQRDLREAAAPWYVMHSGDVRLPLGEGATALPFTARLSFSYPGGFNSGFTNTPTTEEEAHAMVREQAALGVHFTKMWINEVLRQRVGQPPVSASGCPGFQEARMNEAISEERAGLRPCWTPWPLTPWPLLEVTCLSTFRCSRAPAC